MERSFRGPKGDGARWRAVVLAVQLASVVVPQSRPSVVDKASAPPSAVVEP